MSISSKKLSKARKSLRSAGLQRKARTAFGSLRTAVKDTGIGANLKTSTVGTSPTKSLKTTIDTSPRKSLKTTTKDTSKPFKGVKSLKEKLDSKKEVYDSVSDPLKSPKRRNFKSDSLKERLKKRKDK